MMKKTTIKPAAKIAPQIPNIDPKPVTAATPPIAVAPMASPAWRKLLAVPIASPLALKGARSATRAKAAGIASPMPKPKTIPAIIRREKEVRKEKKARAAALIIKPQRMTASLPILSDSLPAGARNNAELA